MAQQNTIAVQIPDEELNQIKAALGTLKTRLVPYLQTLSAQDRQELPKMGDKTLAFVQKTFEYGKQNPDLVPTYLDMQAMEIDVKSVQLLRELRQSLQPIVDALDDSTMLSGSEAYQGALVFYNSVKAAAKVKAGSATTIYDDLSTRFPGAPTKKKSQ